MLVLKRQEAHSRRVAGIMANPAAWPAKGTPGPQMTDPTKFAPKTTPPSPGAQITQLWSQTGYQCVYCAKPAHWRDWTREHIFPKSMGGGNTMRNYLPACSRCNSKRSLTLPIFPLCHPDWQDFVKERERIVCRRTINRNFGHHRKKLEAWSQALKPNPNPT